VLLGRGSVRQGHVGDVPWTGTDLSRFPQYLAGGRGHAAGKCPYKSHTSERTVKNKMNPQEIQRIDRITELVHHLLKGRTPDPIPCENDPGDEIRQLSEKVNQLNQDLGEIKDFIIPLSQGRLETHLPRRNILASPFKQLQSSLNHLTWQTQQIAKGDFHQKVDFMGDFSQAFNIMVSSLREARIQLMAEIDQYKQLAELKNNYLSVMAHDIRTPIGAVIGFADILLERDLGDEERKYIRIIRRNCDSLLALINDILDMAKLEKRKMEIASLPFSVRTLGEDIATMIQPKLNPQVDFVFDADNQIPEMLMGDPHRLQQILLNLVGNAVKFTENGTIMLRIKVLTRNGNHAKLHFSVEDTGIGIAEDRLTRIFNPFAQADGGIASRFGGTGLGLSIARDLTELMGGQLQVESQTGKGTTFHFSLPFDLPEDTELKQHPDDKTVFSKCKILVVDDDPDTLEIATNILGNQKVRFDLCQDSTDAYPMLLRAHREKDPFTLAWLDIKMPKLNGFELAAKIRADDRLDRLCLVACSSHMEKIGHSGLPSYFSFVATKPVSEKALQRILSEASSWYAATEVCDLSGTKVLVADDNPLNRFILRNILEKMDIEIAEAENGAEAVEKVFGGQFDVVLMDKMMPVMDGPEAVRRIRETYDKKALPILFFTADDAWGQEELMATGANGIISKPVDHEDVVDKLCQAMVLNHL